MVGDSIHLDLPRVPTEVSRFVTPSQRPDLYPGTRPAWSYLFTGDEIRPLDAIPEGDYRAILAVGSNACPRRLADPDKFGGRTRVAIPVLRGWVESVVSVYAGWKAVYDSVPATVADGPGARSRLWVNLLDDEQVRRLNESEGVGEDYELLEMSDAVIRTDLGEEVGPLFAYWDRRGLADPATGGLVRLSCFEAEGCDLPAMDQGEAQRALALSPKAIGVPKPRGAR